MKTKHYKVYLHQGEIDSNNNYHGNVLDKPKDTLIVVLLL